MPARTWNVDALPERYGTVGCLVELAGRGPGIIGASHVLCPVWRGVALGARAEVAVLGDELANAALVYWSAPFGPDGTAYGEARDAAAATLSAQAQARLVQTQGLPNGVGDPVLGARVRFIGAHTAVWQESVITSADTPANIYYALYDPAQGVSTVPVLLSGMIQCDAGSLVQGGDSGCLLVDDASRALGLLVGTDRLGKYAYFAPLRPVLDRFQATLLTQGNTPNAPALA